MLSILSILIEILSCAHTKREKDLMISNYFGTFVGRFPSDGAASMAVKGLIKPVFLFCFVF